MRPSPTPAATKDSRYTILGSPVRAPEGEDRPGLSAVVMERGRNPYRDDLVEFLLKTGVGSILYVESPGDSTRRERLRRAFPTIRILSTPAETDTGSLLTIAIRESTGRNVFVLWSDLDPMTAAYSNRLVERLSGNANLCLAPSFRGEEGGLLPTVALPVLQGSGFRTLCLVPEDRDVPTLYPRDYCGLYSRERYLRTGGFDPRIVQGYWQCLDFGLRAWLWGERLDVTPSLCFGCPESRLVEDRTEGRDADIVWMKNIAPVFDGDRAVLRLSRIRRLLFSRHAGPAETLARFLEARVWVTANRYRFVNDIAGLTALWGSEDRGR